MTGVAGSSQRTDITPDPSLANFISIRNLSIMQKQLKHRVNILFDPLQKQHKADENRVARDMQ